jgi:lipopolysaccharide export system permease protein
MKLVTRYLLSQVRRPWLYVIVGFSLVAVLVDLFDNFGDFMEAGTPLRQIAVYYSKLLPTYLPYLLPISLLLALLYALWQLGKNSEIIAMRACGFSLSQLMAPYLLAGLFASLALLAVNELYNPSATYWTRQFKAAQGGDDSQKHLARNLAYKNVVGRRIWRIDRFDPRPETSYDMRRINLTQQRPDGSDEFRMDVGRARWLDGHWWFEEVVTQYYDAQNAPIGGVEALPFLEMTMLSETPNNFINEIKDASERSAIEILRFIDTHKGISAEARNRLMVDFHYRLAAPWLCIIVVLLGIPFGMHSGRRGMGLGILLALLTFFGYYVLMGLGLAYGKQGTISPFVAGWLPSLVFLGIGLYMLHRSR